MQPIVNLIIDGFIGVITRIADDITNFVTGVMVTIMGDAIKLLDARFVINAILLAQTVAGSLLALKIAVEALKAFMLYSNGEATNPGELLKRSAISAALIGSGPWIVKYVYQFGTSLAYDVANLAGADAKNLLDVIHNGVSSTIITPIIIIVAFIIFLLVYMQMFVRSAELVVLAVTGPIMAIDMRPTGGGLTAIWWRELLIISMSQPLQIFLIKCALLAATFLNSADPIEKLCLTIAFLWLAYKSPSVIKQYTYNSGVGGAIGGAAQQAGTMVIMRKMMTRV